MYGRHTITTLCFSPTTRRASGRFITCDTGMTRSCPTPTTSSSTVSRSRPVLSANTASTCSKHRLATRDLTPQSLTSTSTSSDTGCRRTAASGWASPGCLCCCSGRVQFGRQRTCSAGQHACCRSSGRSLLQCRAQAYRTNPPERVHGTVDQEHGDILGVAVAEGLVIEDRLLGEGDGGRSILCPYLGQHGRDDSASVIAEMTAGLSNEGELDVACHPLMLRARVDPTRLDSKKRHAREA